MTLDPIERRLAALVSADVVGYSQLMSEDEVSTVRTLTAYREEMGVLVGQHAGRVVDSPGDNMLLEFSSATDAVECAVELQRVIGARNLSLAPDRRMEFRMGVHLGEVMVEGDRIYGAGVNVAARLETMADPGGICVSKTVHDEVASKVDVEFVDLGEQTLKNIPRPISAFRIEIPLPDEPASQVDESLHPGAEDRRAAWIAVLPFENMSGDPEQDYFADGLTEDVTTRLAAFRSLRVIARTSAFRYEGSDSSLSEIAQELGVRFLLEGSVRKAGNRIRVTAQLVEAEDGHHLWAERYDEELVDIFEVQDRITNSIVAAIDPAIRAAEVVRLSRIRPESWDAWGHTQRGWTEYHKFKKAANRLAREHFEAALTLDPEYAEAHSGLAMTHFMGGFLNWVDDPASSIDRAYEGAKRAIGLDGRDARAHEALAVGSLWMGRLETSLGAAHRAIELNPSSAAGYLVAGAATKYLGRPEEGIELLSKAIELSPQDPLMHWFLGARALAHFMASQLEEAVTDARASLAVRYGYILGRIVLIASLAELDRPDEAAAELKALLGVDPLFTPALLDPYPFTVESDRQRLIDGLRAAGLES
jgi:adenylate cyclase